MKSLSKSSPKAYGLFFLAILLSFFMVLFSLGPRTLAAPAAADLIIYDDALASGWTSGCSWGAAITTNNASPTHTGSASISTQINASDWGGLYACTSTALPGYAYTGVKFWIHGGATGGQQISVKVIDTNDSDDSDWNTGVSVTPSANTWTEVTVLFSQVSDPSDVAGLVWQDATGGPQAVFYVDDITLIGSTATPPTGTNTRTATITRTPGTPTGPTATVPVGGVPPIIIKETAVDSYQSDQFTWYDSDGKPRSAAMVKNNAQDPSGHYGGYMRQYTYQLEGSTTRVVNGSSDTHPGFGYVVNHYSDTASLSHQVAGAYESVLSGRHHAIHQYTWQINMGGPVDVTVQWFFATGRDHPVYAITFDSSPSGPNVVSADTRSPYGDLQWDGGLNSDVEAVGWGDHYKFISTDSPITLASGWDYSQPNTVPYVIEYASAPDAEMGLVQSQTYLQHDAGGYWDKEEPVPTPPATAIPDNDDPPWGETSIVGPMPADWQWPYQLNQYELPWGSTSKRLAWGMNYGAVGQNSFPAYGEDPWTLEAGSLDGYPYQSYSVFIVLDRHSLNPVAGQVTEIETVQNTTLTASTGSVVTSGPAGLGRSDTVTYQPAGYNPIYSTWEVNANASNQAVFNLNVASGTLVDPVFVIHNYTAAEMPAAILVNNIAVAADIGYFASVDTATSTLWLTLKGSFSGNTTISVDASDIPEVTPATPTSTATAGTPTTPIPPGSLRIYLPIIFRNWGGGSTLPTATATLSTTTITPATPTATATAGTPGTPAASLPYVGVSLAGADFGEGNLPGTYGIEYTYPITQEVDYFMDKGMTIFRLPFRWERLQRQQLAAFDTDEMARMDAFVTYATGKGAYVLLDPHNYARYYGDVIGEGAPPVVPATAFADFWTKLANHYKNNNLVIFGLMNEPNEMETELWLADANAAIAAIRATGATNLILVEGNAWSGAHSWSDTWYGGGVSNAEAMLDIVDPGNNYAFEVHQYLDDNSAGDDTSCVNATIGSQRMVNFTNWLRQNNKRGFVGEFGGGANATCLAAIDDLLTYLDNNDDVYLGWTYWAAGPWWAPFPPGDMCIEPTLDSLGNYQDRPQMAILSQHLPK